MAKDWASKPWAVVRGRPQPEQKLSAKNKDLRKREEEEYSTPNREEEVKLDFDFTRLNLESVLFPGLEPLSVLNSDDVERLRLAPKFFQVTSKFFHFCFAIDSSRLEEVLRTFNLLVE